MRAWVFAAVCAAVMVAASAASAQSGDALKKAQASFDQAQTDYLQGNYDAAAQEFQDAYAARPFPQFLYNVGASYHMKGKKASDAFAYGKAVQFYRQYLAEEPNATDKAKVEKTIAVLEEEMKRLNTAGAAQGSGSGAGSGSGSGSASAAPSQEVQQLGDVKVRGLVVIVTEPQNATIYLDDKKNGPMAQTPWSGSLDGEHRLIIEKRGYKPVETTIAADPSKLVQVISTLSQESYLGWIDVTSNVPGALVYLDDKSVGPIGKTPLSQNIKPGKHTFWINAEGYDEYTQAVDIAAGETASVKGTLRGSPVGKLDVSGTGIEDSTIFVDGKVLCARGPCIRTLTEGDHVLTIKRPDYKPYSKSITITAKTETTVRVALKPRPGHGDAITSYVVAALFLGGAIFCGEEEQSIHKTLTNAIAAGNPPPDTNDPRLLRGQLYAGGADIGFLLGGISAIFGIVYTFHEGGAPSTATFDVRALALRPEVGPHFAGLGMEASW